MKNLTEQQIRKVIREEIKNLLFEQEEEENTTSSISKTINRISPLLIAMFALLVGHQDSIKASAKDSEDSKVQSEQELLKAAGINPDKIKEMTNLAGLSPAQFEKLVKIVSLEQKSQKTLDLAKQVLAREDLDYKKRAEVKQILDREQGNLQYYTKQIIDDEELKNGFFNMGVVATNYLINNGKVNDDLKLLQRDLIKYGIEQSEGIALKSAEQDIQTFNEKYVTKDFYIGNSGISDPKNLAMAWLVVNNEQAAQKLTSNLDQEFTAIDIVSALQSAEPSFHPHTFEYFAKDGQAIKTAQQVTKEAGDVVTGQEAIDAALKYKENMNQGEEITPEKIKSMSQNDIDKLSPEVKKAVLDFKAKNNLQENNKVNKLRQRINELRGVYV